MIDELRRLLMIVELQSFTKAAEVLHVTQPALSISIQKLEKYMHATIFHHDVKPLTLTNEGKIIYTLGKKLVLQWENLQSPEFRTTILGKEHIVMGVFDSAALTLAPIFKKFSKNESILLDLVIDDSNTLRTQFALGFLDICICVLPSQRLPSNISSPVAYSYQEQLFPVAKTAKWDHVELSNIPFILYANHSTTREHINDFFLKKGISPKIVAESTSTSFMKELAFLGQGVAFLPKGIIAQDIKNGKLSYVQQPNRLFRPIGIYVKNPTIASSPLFTQVTSLLK